MRQYIFKNIAFLFFLFVICINICCQSKQAESDAVKNHERGDSYEDIRKIDWKKACFDDVEVQRHIQNAELKMLKWPGMAADPEILFSIPIDNPDLLLLLEKGCNDMWQRIHSSDAVFSYGERPFMELIITTNESHFSIFLTENAFIFDEVAVTSVNNFRSWILAKTIDDILLQNKRNGLSAKQFEGLSGEQDLQNAKREYEATIKKL